MIDLVIKAAQLSQERRSQLADEVCGTEGAIPAADSQTKEVWVDFKVGDWFKTLYGASKILGSCCGANVFRSGLKRLKKVDGSMTAENQSPTCNPLS